MRLFDDSLLAYLATDLGTEAVYFVGLGAHDFQFTFGNLRLMNMLRVDFGLTGAEYSWEGGPCAIPAWLLIGQTPVSAALESPSALRLNLASGDWVRLYTDEGPYEAQLMERTTKTPPADLRVY
jgi:hypothetical protein